MHRSRLYRAKQLYVIIQIQVVGLCGRLFVCDNPQVYVQIQLILRTQPPIRIIRPVIYFGHT